MTDYFKDEVNVTLTFDARKSALLFAADFTLLRNSLREKVANYLKIRNSRFAYSNLCIACSVPSYWSLAMQSFYESSGFHG